MKTQKPVKISDAEWPIMCCLWDAGRPITFGDLLQRLGPDAAYTTEHTQLSRLCGKGCVTADRGSGVFRYSAAVPREQCVRGEMRAFVSRVFGDSPSALVLALVSDGELDPGEREKIIGLIKQLAADGKAEDKDKGGGPA